MKSPSSFGTLIGGRRPGIPSSIRKPAISLVRSPWGERRGENGSYLLWENDGDPEVSAAGRQGDPLFNPKKDEGPTDQGRTLSPSRNYHRNRNRGQQYLRIESFRLEKKRTVRSLSPERQEAISPIESVMYITDKRKAGGKGVHTDLGLGKCRARQQGPTTTNRLLTMTAGI